ncbi:uncharacterized protein LOC106179619 [Lingula anatina]|uniref:Uncharacterized protein LOC106179619 n=1 Tax=Lingula anatina TaxID=7574 RepID=A0A1S3K8L8_LINAN|nr:uncharacterized protein LOC106179619 [Lingula anatina]|eukprot:XP_013418789.1 uncharacterized protein LOC106179619 [Lingula anatina]
MPRDQRSRRAPYEVDEGSSTDNAAFTGPRYDEWGYTVPTARGPQGEYRHQPVLAYYAVKDGYFAEQGKSSPLSTSSGSDSYQEVFGQKKKKDTRSCSPSAVIPILIALLVIGGIVAAAVYFATRSEMPYTGSVQPISLTGQMTISNQNYSTALVDRTSARFIALETEFCKGVESSVQASQLSGSYSSCRVDRFRYNQKSSMRAQTFTKEYD